MIQEQIKIHDQQTIELKFEFSVSKETNKKNRYFVNIYLFLPYTIDINKYNFTRDHFYNSIKTYIRLTTPFFLLQNIVKGNTCPYAILLKSANNFIDLPNKDNEEKLGLQLKRFCSIFGTSLRHSSNHIIDTEIWADRKNLITDFIDHVQEIREAFKNLRHMINVPLKSNEIINVYELADEYQSLLVEKHVFRLIEEFNKEDAVIDKPKLTKLGDLVLQEMNYREEREYPSVAKNDRSNEDILYRSSQLKKFIESNLFLNTDTKKDGAFFEQIIFGFAAGVAMIFATAVAFVSQMKFGNLTLPFFVALVVSYIFKDRIKEFVKLYFNKRKFKYFFDYKTNVYNQKNKKIGALKESFLFITHKHLTELISAARAKMRSTEIADQTISEKIIRYRNKIIIFKDKLQERDDFTGFTEILRLNISDFTKKMDDPEKEIFIKTKNGFKKSFVDRVYHFNMILTYLNGSDKQIRLYKLIVSKSGINRIEPINFRMD